MTASRRNERAALLDGLPTRAGAGSQAVSGTRHSRPSEGSPCGDARRRLQTWEKRWNPADVRRETGPRGWFLLDNTFLSFFSCLLVDKRIGAKWNTTAVSPRRLRESRGDKTRTGISTARSCSGARPTREAGVGLGAGAAPLSSSLTAGREPCALEGRRRGPGSVAQLVRERGQQRNANTRGHPVERARRGAWCGAARNYLPDVGGRSEGPAQATGSASSPEMERRSVGVTAADGRSGPLLLLQVGAGRPAHRLALAPGFGRRARRPLVLSRFLHGAGS